MKDPQSAAVEKFTASIIDIVQSPSHVADEYESNRDSFEAAVRKALRSLTKDEVSDILFFMITDHDVFFDVFELSAERKRNEHLSING